MKTEEIIKGNKIIAEFMGKTLPSHMFLPMFFNCSWDWLMPVIEKIKSETEEPEDIDALKHIIWWGTIEDVYMEVL